jgi:hypothetical protein
MLAMNPLPIGFERLVKTIGMAAVICCKALTDDVVSPRITSGCNLSRASAPDQGHHRSNGSRSIGYAHPSEFLKALPKNGEAGVCFESLSV